jgi:hypothetical protein
LSHSNFCCTVSATILNFKITCVNTSFLHHVYTVCITQLCDFNINITLSLIHIGSHFAYDNIKLQNCQSKYSPHPTKGYIKMILRFHITQLCGFNINITLSLIHIGSHFAYDNIKLENRLCKCNFRGRRRQIIAKAVLIWSHMLEQNLFWLFLDLLKTQYCV